MDKENAAQGIADELLTDPDKDAVGRPMPPQTSEAEPTSDRPGQHAVIDDEDED